MNKQLAYLFCGCSLLLGASTVQAQTTFAFGPRVGLNVSTSPYRNELRSYTTGYRTGLEAGLVGQVRVGHLAVQPAVLYSQKGFNIHDTQTSAFSTEQRDNTYRLHYLTVPLNLVFTPNIDGQGFQVAAGGYLGFLLGGKFQAKDTYTSAGYYNYGSTGAVGGSTIFRSEGNISNHTSSTTPAFYSAGADVGLQGNIGYRYAGTLLQVGYSLGLRNLGHDQSRIVYYNRAFQASLSYLFDSKG